MIRSLIMTSLLILAIPFAASAQSNQQLAYANPEDVMNALAEEGYLARLNTDSQGDPKLTGRMSGVNYSVYFYGCDASDCRSLSFYTTFTLNSPPSLSLANDWNASKRFGMAYVMDDGDLGFEMNVNLAHGVSPDNLRDTVDWWRIALDEFLEHIDW